MKYYDKLYKLRKKAGLTQAELADKLNVSRQAVSKWEMGLVVPGIENLLAIGNLFGVSIDYLANDDMESDLDAPAPKATALFFKINYQFIIIRVIIACTIMGVVAIVGAVTNSMTSIFPILFLIGIVFIVYITIRILLSFFSNRKRKEKRKEV